MFSMFRRKPRCPVAPDVQQWIDARFNWLKEHLGSDVPRDAKVILPTEEYFPDAFSADVESAQRMLTRIAGYMNTDARRFELFAYTDVEREALQQYGGHHTSSFAAGLYLHPADTSDMLQPVRIGIEHSQLLDPMALAATLAHEVGHEILLGRQLVSPDQEDHEPLTDLLTVFMGMGIFTANATIRDRGWSDGMRTGWRTSRLGYLDQTMYGYALALFALSRGEKSPTWLSHLRPDVRSPMQASISYLHEACL